MNLAYRVLDLVILVVLTLAVSGRLIPAELAKVLVVYCGLLMMAVFSFFHMYPSWRLAGVGCRVRDLALAWAGVLIVFNLVIILLSNKEQLNVLTPFGLFSSAGFNFWALLIFGGLAAARAAACQLAAAVRKWGRHRRSAVVIGAGSAGRKLARFLSDNRWPGIEVIGFFDDNLPIGTAVKNESQFLGNVLGATDACLDYAGPNRVDLFFLALPMRAERKIAHIVGRLGTSGHAVLMVQDLFSYGIHKARTQHLGELQLLDFYLFPMWKRLFDIVFSIVMVGVTSPLWLIIALAIKAEDGGPVFFRHPRVMEGGILFNCLKFRSMHLDAHHRLEQLLDRNPTLRQEWQERYKLENDPRVTRVGKFLRRFSLDELPQFLNVLSGQMSVVGARPVVPEELEKYYREMSLTYCAMKPGITGPWQVSSRSAPVDYAGRIELDRKYILNCTLGMDLKIMLKTLWRIIHG